MADSDGPERFLPLPSATLHILIALATGEKHGYAIMRDVEALSDGHVRMGPGTLYGSVKRMLKDGLIEETVERPDPELDDQRRRYYRLTSVGERVRSAELQRLEALVKRAGSPEWARGAYRAFGRRDVHLRMYQALLVLYPRSFRQDYREPMLQLFGDCLRDRGAKAWLRAVPDLVRTVPALRVEAIMSAHRSIARVVAMALIVLGAAFVVVGRGGPAVLFALLLVVLAVLAAGRGALVPVFRGEQAPLRHALVQTWWAPLAGLLGGAMILAGVGTIFEAHNWGGRIFGSAILIAFGVGMLYGLKRRPFARQSGNALILLTTIPAFPLFWLIVPAAVALIIWVGVLTSGFSDDAVASAST